MKTSDIAKVKIHREEMLDSYVRAIRQAGGDGTSFLKSLDNMTVAEMMDILAQNGVRFYYDYNSKVDEEL